MDLSIKYAKENLEEFIGELKEYLRIPSISTLVDHKNHIITCTKFVKEKLLQAGMNKVEIYETPGNPLIYAEWLEQPDKPTVLIYGHYDVQPVDPISEWETEPFEPTIIGNKIFARGANDNKGQNFAHIKSIQSIFKTEKKLPCNVKFLFEGEEEIGSENLYDFIKQNKSLLKCDTVLISDTSLYQPDMPAINYSLRGLCYMEIEIISAEKDMHSGTYGGTIANPINVLANIISKLHDKNGKVAIPGFYKNVMEITKEEKKNFKRLKFSEKNFTAEIGAKKLVGEKGFTPLERIWTRPTLDCNGIVGGFIGEGAKTVLPAKASSKISMRLVPNQDPNVIAKLFETYIKKITPKSVTVNVKSHHGGFPVIVPIDSKAIQSASRATTKAFGKKTLYTRDGGSIPIVVEFMNKLNAPVILMGFGLDSENIHSPNEHFDLANFEKGIFSSIYFLYDYSENY